MFVRFLTKTTRFVRAHWKSLVLTSKSLSKRCVKQAPSVIRIGYASAKPNAVRGCRS